MEDIVIVSAARTAVGKFEGSLAKVPATELGSIAIKAALGRAKVSGDQVDELICGNILPAGLGQGIARQIAVGAGIPVEVCAYSLNMICGSGMKAVLNGIAGIKLGESEIVVAGGVENMSSAPYLLPKETRKGIKMGAFQVQDHMVLDALTDAFDNVHMGVTAENIAVKYGITREAQDAFAYASQQKAIKAVDEGAFDEEIVPIEVKIGREMVTFARDEYPNRTTSPEKLARLRPAFLKDGTVTAGNASGINDGGAAVVVMTAKKASALGLTPLARIASYATVGLDPATMGLGPVGATQKALQRAGWKAGDVDLYELNEAFAAQACAVNKLLGIDPAKVNVNGGAIAIGHPIGASGCRILVTLLHEMKRSGAKKGLAGLCIGGGMGVALAVER